MQVHMCVLTAFSYKTKSTWKLVVHTVWWFAFSLNVLQILFHMNIYQIQFFFFGNYTVFIEWMNMIYLTSSPLALYPKFSWNEHPSTYTCVFVEINSQKWSSRLKGFVLSFHNYCQFSRRGCAHSAATSGVWNPYFPMPFPTLLADFFIFVQLVTHDNVICISLIISEIEHIFMGF